MVIPASLPEWIRWAFLGLAAVLALISLIAWAWGRGKGDAAPSGQTSYGSRSPNLSGISGPVYIGDVHHVGEEKAERCPDDRVADAIEAIQSSTGMRDQAFAEFRQAARDGRVNAWGRAEIPPTYTDAPDQWHELWTKIPRTYWDKFRLVADLDVLRSALQPHTIADEGHFPERQRYWSVRVENREIAAHWPPRPTRHSSSKPVYPPHPDITLEEVATRLFAMMGAKSVDRDGRHKFVQRVNHAIVDGIKLHNLTVWARFSNHAIKPLGVMELSNASVDVFKGILRNSNGWNNNDYSDVQFVSSEIAGIWPPISPKDAENAG